MTLIEVVARPMRRARDFFASLFTVLDQDEPLLCECDVTVISPECATAPADG